MPKLPPAQRIANSVALILVARICMALFGPAFVGAATIVYNGQVEMQRTLDAIKLDIARLNTTQQLAGEGRDRAITSLDSRLTYIERQAHR